MSHYDLLVIGGGINGCGIARDAAGRGLRVALCEQGDLAGGTSWTSSKLIHGGLRYLEHGEFRLVREALAERAILLRIAPHLVHPLRLVLPRAPGMRPDWMIRLGLWVYDHLGGARHLPGSRAIALTADLGLEARYTRGFEYSDAQVDDARLVVLNALDAASRGARILVGACVTTIAATGTGWEVRVQQRGRERVLRAKVLVNAAGPWAQRVLGLAGIDAAGGRLRLVRGSHIVLARKPASRGLLLQNEDGRVVFMLPLAADFTLVGTTDVDADDPSDIAMSDDEREYLMRVTNRYLAQKVTAADIAWSFAGLRALYDDGAKRAQEVTRDYVLRLDRIGDSPCLSVLGGKITTYRRLAEHAMERIAPFLEGMGAPWTASGCLPGGNMPDGAGALLTALGRERPALPAAFLAALVARHGSLAGEVLGDAAAAEDLGCDFGGGLHQIEVDHFVRAEWARSGADIAWRRTKCGLRMSAGQLEVLDAYVRELIERTSPAATAV